MFPIVAQAANAAGTAAQQPTALSYLYSFAPLIIIVVLFYFVLIRPQKKRENQTREMINAIVVGDELVSIGGITGKVITVKDEEVVIETGSDKNKIRLQKWAIKEVTQKKAEEKA